MMRFHRSMPSTLAAFVLSIALTGSALAQAVMPDPNPIAVGGPPPSVVPETRAVATPSGWMLVRVEAPTTSALMKTAQSAATDERKSNLRAIVTASGAAMLEDADGAPAASPTSLDPSRFTVRTTASGQQLLELKGTLQPQAATARTASSPASALKVVDIKRSELAAKWPSVPAPMTLYRIVE